MKNTVIGIILIGFVLLLLFSMGHERASSDALGVIMLILFGVAGYFVQEASKKFSGSWGEHKALTKLETNLPDGFHIFTNIRVHERMESDMVVVGPTGVFVLEVKNLNGTIEGSADDKVWTLHKVGQRGGRYSKDLKNPLGQMRRNVFILSQYLKMKGIFAWVDGFVLFPNSNTEWKGEVPLKCLPYSDVKRLGELLPHYPTKRPLTEKQIEKIVDCLNNCLGVRPAMTKAEFEKKVDELKQKQKHKAKPVKA